MTTDEALAIAAKKRWTLVPVHIWPSWEAADEWQSQHRDELPDSVECWWVIMVAEERLYRQEDGRIASRGGVRPFGDRGPEPVFSYVESVPQRESLAPTVVEAVERMLAKEPTQEGR